MDDSENEGEEDFPLAISAKVGRIFLGDSDKELYPQDVVAIAEKVLEDKKYVALVEFYMGDRCWDAIEGDIRAYKDIGDTVAVEEIGRGKLLVVNSVRIIPRHSVRGDLLGRLHKVHKGADTTVRTAWSLSYWPGMAHEEEKRDCWAH